MCRFAIYQGPTLPASHLLVNPSHSLLKQSYACKERSTPTNEDGYGIGWYATGPSPNWIHGERPAHLDPVFESTASSIRSHCLFGHVRAATKGMHVRIENCHPFSSGSLLWMHNGLIAGFESIEPLLREETKELDYTGRGNTDSEASFTLFLKKLQGQQGSSPATLQQAMIDTVTQLESWKRELGIEETHYLNLAVTDGNFAVATRYYRSTTIQLTLYVWRGDAADIAGWSQSTDFEPGPAVIVASEPLNGRREGWEAVPINHLVTFGRDTFQFTSIIPTSLETQHSA